MMFSSEQYDNAAPRNVRRRGQPHIPKPCLVEWVRAGATKDDSPAVARMEALGVTRPLDDQQWRVFRLVSVRSLTARIRVGSQRTRSALSRFV